MGSVYLALNMPIHLARRDAYFEHSAALIYLQAADQNITQRIEQVTRILSVLATAKKHARFTVLAEGNDEDQDFYAFIKLISHSANAIHTMMKHQLHLEAAEGFLFKLLRSSAEQRVMPALHYRRRADDLNEGLCHLLRLAHAPFRELQIRRRNQMKEYDRDRYIRAYAFYREELQRIDASDLSDQKLVNASN